MRNSAEDWENTKVSLTIISLIVITGYILLYVYKGWINIRVFIFYLVSESVLPRPGRCLSEERVDALSLSASPLHSPSAHRQQSD